MPRAATNGLEFISRKRYSTILLLLSLAVRNKMYLHQIEVRTAYLNSSLQDEIYVWNWKLKNNNLVLIAVYVDDLIVGCSNIALVHDVKRQIVDHFEVNDKCVLNHFQGMEVEL